MVRPLSARARKTPASPIRRLAGLASSARAEGAEVLHLNIGQPDVASPPEFLNALSDYDQNIVAYEASEGNQSLRSAWSEYMNEELTLETDPEQFLITMGASEALIFLFMAICDPGDEVVIFDPTYANYIGFAALTGVELRAVPSSLEEGFRLPALDRIRGQISRKTKAILLCSPNNPTGTTYSRDEIAQLLELCHEHDLFFIVDETYRELVFDNQEPISVLHLAPKDARIAVVDSLSKRFSLCGARIGCLYSPNEELIAKSLNMAQARLAAPSVEQFAAAELLRAKSFEYVSSVKAEYQSRRDVLCDRLKQIPGVDVHIPSGAFYTVIRLPVEDAEAFSSFLLREFRSDNQTLFLAPASGFYMEPGKGVQKVRIAFVLEKPALIRAGDILETALTKYS